MRSRRVTDYVAPVLQMAFLVFLLIMAGEWAVDKIRGRRNVSGSEKVSDMSVERLERIQAAYAESEEEQPADYEPLPKWETLPIQLREAIIHVFLAGRLDALSEWKS